MKARLKCFVASALDYPDVDAIYDRAIRQVIKDLKIGVYRVDRVDHNDDIDDRIFAMLDDSDLCIADLTYARPSVYYEAGYAFGGDKPVVYIARKDHLDKKAEDNRRVHFDLQMKNIIAWTSPDEAFKQKLRRRVQLVTAPVVARLEREERSPSRGGGVPGDAAEHAAHLPQGRSEQARAGSGLQDGELRARRIWGPAASRRPREVQGQCPQVRSGGGESDCWEPVGGRSMAHCAAARGPIRRQSARHRNPDRVRLHQARSDEHASRPLPSLHPGGRQSVQDAPRGTQA